MGKLKDQIDASVFMEHLLPAPVHNRKTAMQTREACRNYFYKLHNEIINGTISDGALGEIWSAVHKKVPKEKRDGILRQMNDLIDECKLVINGPSAESCMKAVEIMEFDTRIDPGDALRLAEASASGQERFVTIDKHLLENKQLENIVGIKIVSPK